MTAGQRVLVFCGDKGIPLLGPGGASAHLRGVVRALVNRGHQVCVATPTAVDHRGTVAEEPLPAMGVHAPPRKWTGPLRERGETWDARRLMRHALRQFQPDLLWERHSLFVDAGVRAQKRLGIPRLLEINAPLILERPRIRGRKRAMRLTEQSLRTATGVAAVSDWLARWVVERGALPGRVARVCNGTRLRPADGAPQGLVLAFVGSCRPWHGLHRFVPLLEALPEARVRIFGSGPTAPPSHPRIEPVGHLAHAELSAALAQCSVGLWFADPARPWPCPLKLLDYRAVGLPVVADDGPEVRHLCGPHLRVASGEPANWAAAVREAAALPRIPQVRQWETVVDESLRLVQTTHRSGER